MGDKFDNEYFVIKQRKHQEKKMLKKNAPRFREYIKLLIDSIDLDEEGMRKLKFKEYRKKWVEKNKLEDKQKEYQKNYRKKNGK